MALVFLFVMIIKDIVEDKAYVIGWLIKYFNIYILHDDTTFYILYSVYMAGQRI